MGNNIKVYFTNGEVADFPHTGRAGGSYTKTVRYEGEFVIITDEYYKETAYPSFVIAKIEVIPDRF